MTFQGSGLTNEEVLSLFIIEYENPPDMKRVLSFLVLFSFLGFSQKEIQAQCNQPEPAATACNIAPTLCPSSGLLDHYCGKNDDFNFDPSLQPPGFCATIQNPDWIGFIPVTTEVEIQFWVATCEPQAINIIPSLQAMVFKGCAPDWEPASDCYYSVQVNTGQLISLTNLIPGEEYYLLIDGFQEAVCDYDLTVQSGQLAGNGNALEADAGADVLMECNMSAVLDGSNSTYTQDAIFTWLDESGAVVGNGVSYTTTETGVYTLRITDPDLSICPSENEVSVFPAGIIALELGDGDFLDCNSGETIIIGENVPLSPDYTYFWTTFDGSIISGQTSPAPTVNMPGTYFLTMEDVANNCTFTDQIQVTEFENIMTVNSPFYLTCDSDGVLNLDVVNLTFDSPHFTYSWTTADGQIEENGNKRIPTISSIGNYNITFMDTISNCEIAKNVMVIDTVPSPTPIIEFGNNQVLTCNETEVELTAVNSIIPSPVTYRWIKPSGGILSTNESISVSQAGIYTLELMKILTGCVYSTQVDVVENTYTPYVNFPMYTYELSCDNNYTQEIIPSVSTGWNIGYDWSINGWNVSTNANLTVTSGDEGIYELTVTNYDNGCSSYASVEVVKSGFDVDINITDANCDEADGIALMISSGIINPLYEWSNGMSGIYTSGLSQGWYSVTTTDLDNNCSSHENFYVDEDISCKVVISGYVVNDPNNMCTFDPAMEGIGQVLVKLYPLGIYTMTDSTGYYEFVVDDGSYTVQFIGSQEVDLQCPTIGAYSVTLDVNGSVSSDNHYYVLRKSFDFCIGKNTGTARPGFNQFNCLNVCNYGGMAGDAEVTFTHDSLFLNQIPWPSISPAYGNMNAPNYTYDSAINTFTWNLDDLVPGECRKIMWWMPVPNSAVIGDTIYSEAKVNPIIGDDNPLNNCLAWNRIVMGSFDPNIKENYVGESLLGGAIYENETTMDYQIHFQNVGNDTAFTVVVRDTLDDAHLDVTTIRGFTSSHDMQVEFEGANVLIFRFENIYLVDSLTNEEASKGWVGFQIDLLPNQVVGTEVLNQAAIFFDFNAPIITNEIVNTVDQHFYKIEGVIKTEIGEGVKDVNILLSGDLVATSLTDDLGYFSFEDLNPNESFDLVFEKDINPWNGVTTQDIVAIRKHILGLEYLDSPYKLLAADVNNSESITGLDMVLIRSLILLNTMEFADNDSWRIIDGAHIFTDPTQPWSSPIPEHYAINNIDADRFYNMIGIKMGDVNNSAQPWNILNAETRVRNENLTLSVGNQKIRVGGEIVVAMRAKDFEEMVACQFTLEFDEEKLVYTGFEKGVLEKMSEQNIGTRFLENGKLTFAWTTSEGRNVNDGEPLFFLKFKANQKGSLNKILQINSTKTEAVAYDEDENIFDINLTFEGESEASVLQVFPNPTDENIFININLDKTCLLYTSPSPRDRG